MLEHMAEVFGCLRGANVALRWLLLHTGSQQRRLRAAVASAAPPPQALLGLLLDTRGPGVRGVPSSDDAASFGASPPWCFGRFGSEGVWKLRMAGQCVQHTDWHCVPSNTKESARLASSLHRFTSAQRKGALGAGLLVLVNSVEQLQLASTLAVVVHGHQSMVCTQHLAKKEHPDVQ